MTILTTLYTGDILINTCPITAFSYKWLYLKQQIKTIYVISHLLML
jgi:hypothetical protein